MKGARLTSLPVRWRLTAASAGLTMVILIAFAVVVGRLVADQIREDFDAELRSAAGALASETSVGVDPALGPVVSSPMLNDFAMANDAVIRVVDIRGRPLAKTRQRVDLGVPSERLTEIGDLKVATAPVSDSGSLPAFVQYARSEAEVNSSIDRLWLFLGGGVLIATALAALAGLAIANRAMGPIASLTRTAREIAATRDPSSSMPEPQSDDEVGELARTLAEMLRALDQSRSERERAFDRQRAFVADASHELRTPLTSVLANLELLAEELEPGSEGREIVDSALSSSRRMRRLVSDLLLLARADAGKPSARTRCDLAEIAFSAAAEVEPLADRHLLEVRIAEPLPVSGSPDELHRLVVNLLDNAVRHTPPGTRVELVAGRRDGEAVIEVGDSGPGIPAGAEDRVFERFVRGVASADVAAADGSGLGLSIVRAVAESHGGGVELTRSPAGGALFTVTLPPAGANDRHPQAEVPTDAPPSLGPSRSGRR